jgi:ABC-2 type transport system ATP-binding protein
MINAHGLARRFRAGRKGAPVDAVAGVDISVEAGEIVGFLGPNGAGKTTTQRMLTTLLLPTTGEATVAGCDLLRDPRGVRRRIGYVAQGSGASPESTVAEELEIQGRLYGLSRATARARAGGLVERLELTGLERRLVRTLSGGQRRRLEVALGLIHTPALLFLDEPTTGLDPQSRANLWNHLRLLRSENGTTLFLTTHYLDEADVLCDRVLVMDHGRIIAEGTPDSLKARVTGDTVAVNVSPERVTAAAGITGQIAGVRDITVDEALVRFRVPDAHAVLPLLLRALDAAAISTTSLQVNRPTLDDVFFALTGRTLRDAGQGVPPKQAKGDTPDDGPGRAGGAGDERNDAVGAGPAPAPTAAGGTGDDVAA